MTEKKLKQYTFALNSKNMTDRKVIGYLEKQRNKTDYLRNAILFFEESTSEQRTFERQIKVSQDYILEVMQKKLDELKNDLLREVGDNAIRKTLGIEDEVLKKMI